MRHIALFLLLASLAGCSTSVNNSEKKSYAETPFPSPTYQTSTPVVDWALGIEVSLAWPERVAEEQTVELKLRLKNRSAQPVELTLGGREDMGYPGTSDFLISRSDGLKVWRWLDGKALQAIGTRRVLNPGEEMAFTVQWTQVDSQGKAVPAGTYYVTGYFHLNLAPTPILTTGPQLIVIY